MWELDHKEDWALKNCCFRTVVLEKSLESLLYSKELKPVNPKTKSTWIFIRRTDVEAEAPILWSPDMRSHAWVCATLLQSCPTLWDPICCSTLGFFILLYHPEFAQIHVHWVGNAIQLLHPPLPPSPPALSLSQHQDLFQWVRSSHHVAKILELQLQHQSFQWMCHGFSSKDQVS